MPQMVQELDTMKILKGDIRISHAANGPRTRPHANFESRYSNLLMPQMVQELDAVLILKGNEL